jgi:hypothetical protein
MVTFGVTGEQGVFSNVSETVVTHFEQSPARLHDSQQGGTLSALEVTMPRTGIGLFAWFFLLTSMVAAWACADAYGQAASATACVVYVVGAVENPRGYALRKGEKFAIRQAVAIAGGLTETASKGSARIIRREDGSRLQIPIDLNKALQGKSQGVELNCDDILFIPDKNRARRSSPYMDPPMTFPDKDRSQRASLPS